jgi:hypothetical protein
MNVSGLKFRLLVCCALVATVSLLAIPPHAAAQANQDQAQLVERIKELEQQLAKLTAAAPAAAQPARPAPAVAQAQGQRGGNPPAAPAGQGQRGAQTPPPAQNPPMQMPMPAANTGPLNPENTPPDSTDPQALLDRIKTLEQRIRDLETSTVLSEPETRVKKVEVYVDKDGTIHDEPTPGAKKEITYQRERVYRRQTISEKIEEAMADAEEHNVKVGVDAGIVGQYAAHTTGHPTAGDGHAYALASADLFFTAGVAQHTLFFADVVGLSGPNPEGELEVLTLVNGYSARLVKQNDISLREAWLKTELFSQKLAITAGRLDLTNYFDHNIAANDETTQFLSDALVNNPALGLSTNGTGAALVFDPKSGLTFKIGLQQSNTDATNLSDSLFTLAEIGYLARPFRLPEGNYRFWYRTDNGGPGPGYRIAFGTSIDQKLRPGVTFFARYGAAQADVKRDHFYSGGLQFDNGLGFYPGDAWGVGYAQNDVRPNVDLPDGGRERLIEGYYRFNLTERLNLSFHVQHFLEYQGGGEKVGYLIPGVRLQASF